MTLFTKRECVLCDRLKKQFDLSAMKVQVEVLDGDNADSLAHLAWHGLVDTARKTLPLLILDDSSNVQDFVHIEMELSARAALYGVGHKTPVQQHQSCDAGSCCLNTVSAGMPRSSGS
ncbi:MAG: hypothetical protein KKE17_05225 [Proteobacteria bacterium]|nr:hypothetical protein [Pseudomonadota bacterium]